MTALLKLIKMLLKWLKRHNRYKFHGIGSYFGKPNLHKCRATIHTAQTSAANTFVPETVIILDVSWMSHADWSEFVLIEKGKREWVAGKNKCIRWVTFCFVLGHLSLQHTFLFYFERSWSSVNDSKTSYLYLISAVQRVKALCWPCLWQRMPGCVTQIH